MLTPQSSNFARRPPSAQTRGMEGQRRTKGADPVLSAGIQELRDLGFALLKQNRLNDALSVLEKLLSLAPKDLLARQLMGRLCLRLSLHDVAESQFKIVLAAIPHNASALSGMVDVALARDDTQQAKQLARKILKHHPSSMVGHLALAHAHEAAGEYQAALDLLGKTVQKFPGDASAQYHWGRALLRHGDLMRGWKARDHVYAAGVLPTPVLASPWWQGETVDRLLVLADEGLGDTILFSRYLYEAAKRAKRITLAGDASLINWLSMTLPVDVIAREGLASLEFDAHIPVGVLPGILNLQGDAYQMDGLLQMQQAQEPFSPMGRHDEVPLKIGVSLECSQFHSTEQNPATRRTFQVDCAQPLLQIAGAHFYNIQKKELPQAHEIFGDRWHETSDEISDFADTVRLVRQMDAIVTIDSVLVHVAGVLGKPTWLVLPRAADWRWGLHPNDNRWYPSVRLVREKAGMVRADLFKSVAAELMNAAHGPKIDRSEYGLRP